MAALLIALSVAVILSFRSTESIPSPNGDILALIIFKSSIDDPFEYLSSWKEDDLSPCQWKFVNCDPFSGRVSGIFLGGLGLSGKIDSLELEKLPTLKVLELARNNFYGSIPLSIGPLFSLQRLDLSHNSLSGSIPENIRNFNSLVLLNLSSNHFSGDVSFSGGVWSLKKLRYLDLSHNSFSGLIPIGISALHFLKEIKLESNQFSGHAPSDVGLCTHLNRLDFSGNKLDGELPASLFRLKSLISIILSNNSFTGNLTTQIRLLRSLEFIDLSSNSLSGSIPPSLFDLPLKELRFDRNSFSGSIPKEIGNCSSLNTVSLSHNSLTGQIPSTLSSLSMMKILDLEFNGFSGMIPETLSELDHLVAVNFSYNNLIGNIPNGGIFRTADRSAFAGNVGICFGDRMIRCGKTAEKPLAIDPLIGVSPVRRRKFFSTSSIFAISAAVMIALGVLIVCVLNYSSPNKTFVTLPTLVLFEDARIGDPDSLMIEPFVNGKGGVSRSVYRISLGPNGFAAMKMLELTNIIQTREDFDGAVRTLAMARHPNLAELKGYYWTRQCRVQRRFLISSFVQNGNLETVLHHGINYDGEQVCLSWKNRFEILVGTAKGLAYLHHSCHPPIIHCAVKPCNILLDDDLQPKVSDFGLSRLWTKHDTDQIGRRFKNALGYIAPEFGSGESQVNEKYDVYGFGVMALEVVTGRRAAEYGGDTTVILRDVVKVLMKNGGAMDCVDPKMVACPEDEVIPVMRLALRCTRQSPAARPTMAEVLQMMKIILKNG